VVCLGSDVGTGLRVLMGRSVFSSGMGRTNGNVIERSLSTVDQMTFGTVTSAEAASGRFRHHGLNDRPGRLHHV
jgi:hypothetical protein